MTGQIMCQNRADRSFVSNNVGLPDVGLPDVGLPECRPDSV